MTIGSTTPPLDATPCANHLDRPAETVCTRCGDFICVECTTFGEGGHSTCPRCMASVRQLGEGVPWEKQGDKGVVKAFWETARGAVFSPGSFYKRVDPAGGYGSPISFILLGGMLFAAAMTTLEQVTKLAAPSTSGSAESEPGKFIGLIIASTMIMPVFMLIYNTITAAIVHLFCMMVGANSAGFRGTFRGLAYTSATQVFGAGVLALLVIPTAALGDTAPWLLWLATAMISIVGIGHGVYGAGLLVFMIRDVHRTTTGRALVAVLISFVLSVLVVCGCPFLIGFYSQVR